MKSCVHMQMMTLLFVVFMAAVIRSYMTIPSEGSDTARCDVHGG